MGGVGLLHHGAEEAGVLGDLALQDLAAEVDVAEQPSDRVFERVVGRRREEPGRHLAEVRGGGDPELLLGAEVVEERALGHPRRLAELVDRGGGEALAPDHRQRGVEELAAGVLAGGHRDSSVPSSIPTGRYACQAWRGAVRATPPLLTRPGYRENKSAFCTLCDVRHEMWHKHRLTLFSPILSKNISQILLHATVPRVCGRLLANLARGAATSSALPLA
jgi:hypothetical protein